MMKPNSYYWNLEILLEQYSAPHTQGILFEDSELTWNKGFDFEKSTQHVFSDEHGHLYSGLRQSSYTQCNGKYIFLTDNHNKVLTPLFWCFQKLQAPLSIVHIDAHRDDAIFQYPTSSYSLDKESIALLESQCRVSDYLDAGQKIGLIGDIVSVTQSIEFDTCTLPNDPYILNLDIDIFGPEGDAVDFEIKIRGICDAWSRASAVCIATSPGFIDRDHAQKIIEIFISSFGKK